jgi:hypothetical protein
MLLSNLLQYKKKRPGRPGGYRGPEEPFLSFLADKRGTGEGKDRSRGLHLLVYSTNILANKNLLLVLLGDPDCVESQIIRVVCQIVRFDFD